MSIVQEIPKMVIDWRRYRLSDIENRLKRFDFLKWKSASNLMDFFKASIQESINVPPTNLRKKYTIKEWSEKIGIPASTIYGHFQRKKLRVGDYFIILRKAVVLPSNNELKRFTVKEWARKHKTTPHCSYSRLKSLNLKLPDHFRKNRRKSSP